LDWPKFPDNPAPEVVLITRPDSSSPASARPRQCRDARCVINQVPRTCTRITASKSAGVMFQMTLSRAIPALFTTMSSRPNSLTARSTSSPACASSAMSP